MSHFRRGVRKIRRMLHTDVDADADKRMLQVSKYYVEVERILLASCFKGGLDDSTRLDYPSSSVRCPMSDGGCLKCARGMWTGSAGGWGKRQIEFVAK
ncbi:GL16755 [Drosophila persimilis]|uniref:GL16755 n=1 Tax=Drosophila persimilis TaxID=7234 RepID=B4HDB4_DROPE|nr:GL16755 [Drosophila persimilis]